MIIEYIHGRLTRDPEYTQGSEPSKDRVNFTVASDRRYGDETEFTNCVMWGKRAGVINKYFAKGSEIVLLGEPQTRQYTDRDGNKRKSTSCVVIDFDFCGSRRDSGADPQQNQSGDSWEQFDEDIPFDV